MRRPRNVLPRLCARPRCCKRRREYAMHDLLISGGTVVAPQLSARLEVAVDGEIVVAVGDHGTLGPARRVIDADGCLVFPGGVDPHVHYSLERPGPSRVRSETQAFSHAAACGGTTTMIDFAIQE